MDLSSIKTKANEVELTIPGIGATGFFLTLRYESSPEVQKVNKIFEEKIMTEARKGKRGDRSGATEWYKKEKILAHIADWRWTGDANYHGETPPYSKEKAHEMLSAGDNFSYFMRDFIEDQISDASDFLEQSAKS